MALIICPDCGMEVSDRASSCPKCGSPIQDEIDRIRAGKTIVDLNISEKEIAEIIYNAIKNKKYSTVNIYLNLLGEKYQDSPYNIIFNEYYNWHDETENCNNT